MQERPVVQNRSARGWWMEGVGAMYFWPFCENARTAFVKCEVQGTAVRRGVELAAVAPERQYQARLQCTMHNAHSFKFTT